MSERWFPDSMPNPMVDTHTLPWWRAAAEHRLQVQVCDSCGHGMLPPAPVCAECHASELSLKDVSGEGRLYTFTNVHQPVSLEQELPFVIAIIELDCGDACDNAVRMMSNIVDGTVTESDIGRTVHVAWETMSEEVSIPRFRFSG
jgi:uncharacterized OB-fold protein